MFNLLSNSSPPPKYLPMQWSPTEVHVFASCSVDGNIAIWDTRLGRSPAASFKAHNADVNVLSWNRCLNLNIAPWLQYFSVPHAICSDLTWSFLIPIRLASCMLASGSDDGTFSIRDLRLLKVCIFWEYFKVNINILLLQWIWPIPVNLSKEWPFFIITLLIYSCPFVQAQFLFFTPMYLKSMFAAQQYLDWL